MPLTPDARSKVLWFGPAPSDAHFSEFKHRDLILDINLPNPALHYRLSRTVIFKFNALKPGRLFADMQAHAFDAVDNGLKVIAVADDHVGQNVISDAVNKLNPLFNVYRMTSPATPVLAESAARHDPGSQDYPQLIITVAGPKQLSPTEALLFRRAFWDCREIRIQPLDGGNSANVFSVYAIFRDFPVGPRPLPFFAKIDKRHKIERELRNYVELTEQFVPFSSRPNLDHSRCLVASSKGIIVGNFVEQSEPLWDLAVRGHANSAIFSLFEEALRGWRLQAYQQGSEALSHANLYAELGPIFDPARVHPSRTKLAHSLGASLKPHEIATLAQSLPGKPHRSAPIHGDLHARNIRVRESDAILIDFASTRSGPIVADPASLEVALMFSIVNKEDDNKTWRSGLVDKLATKAYLKQAPPPADQPLPREWLWNAVRQIRLYALSMETNTFEYATVLAIYLLRYSMFPSDEKDFREEERRAYAYVVAERLLKMIEAESKSK